MEGTASFNPAIKDLSIAIGLNPKDANAYNVQAMFLKKFISQKKRLLTSKKLSRCNLIARMHIIIEALSTVKCDGPKKRFAILKKRFPFHPTWVLHIDK